MTSEEQTESHPENGIYAVRTSYALFVNINFSWSISCIDFFYVWYQDIVDFKLL